MGIIIEADEPSPQGLTLKAAGAAINQLSVQVMVLETALFAVLRRLPESESRDIASDFRQRAASAMQQHAGHLLPADDAHMSRAIAAVLEALGQPPAR